MKKSELLSKTLSHALRHEPWLYELELDNEGWVLVSELLSALREKREWANLTETDLMQLIKESSKQRHEIKNGKIRALYGHSTPNKLIKKLAEPPEILYHGTSLKNAKIICNEGLKPMERHYVHLSIDTETAMQVGYRKSSQPKILKILAQEAYQNGVCFYKGNEHVWLADIIPEKFINFYI